MDSQTSQLKKKRTQMASWNKKNTIIFCDICIQAIEKGMRPKTHLSIEGWGFVINKFNAAKSGNPYDKTMLKNKWDQLKKKWKIWKELIGEETGLVWDSKAHTINATQEWWDEKIKVLPAAAKFRKEGLEPDLADRLDIMFSDTMGMGERVRAHCSAIVLANGNENNNVHVVSEEGNVDGEEGGGDSLEEDFEKSLDELMQNTPENVDNASRNKRKLEKSTSDEGKNAKGGAPKLREDISRVLGASVESRTSIMPTPTIAQLMEEVRSLPGVQIGSELYYFASYVLERRAKRESYLTMAGPEEKLGWLKFQYEMVKREKTN